MIPKSPSTGEPQYRRRSSLKAKPQRSTAQEDVSDENAAVFIRARFDKYAAASQGKPLMNLAGVLQFFRDFAGGSAHEPQNACIEQLYAEELELQADMRFRFNLTRAESGRGLCFQSFQVVLEKALPFNVAISLAKEMYMEYSQDLSVDGGTSVPGAVGS